MRAGLLSALIVLSTAAGAVEVNRLWLPRSQWALEPDLILAAERAELTDRCAEVLSGKWLQSASTPERPVLMIVCRDSITGRSYYRKYARLGALRLELLEEQGRATPSTEIARPVAVASDSLSATPGAETAEPDTVDSAAPAETGLATADAGGIAAEQADADVFEAIPLPDRLWATCLSALHRKIAPMLGVVVHEEPRPTLRENADGGGAYTILFDARNPRGDMLYYQADCEVAVEGEVAVLRLRPRPADQPGEPAGPS
ncbi:MAG TPA: hypothetical protein VL027_07110 [Spongiibacteraceae bacterium]|jgi:hypothetical protein|nr:hypothetical protein [Spongiibacteraceae bacterium]HUH37695.1 hypothetical protein [Spongiibacteraceae bacterium]